MILATLTAEPTTRAHVQRSYLDMVVFGWWEHIIIQAGQYTILQEVPFGGYRVHVKFNDWFWNWNSHTASAENAIEFLHATAPGSGTPIAAGTVKWVSKYEPLFVEGGILNIQFEPNDNHYTAVRLPTDAAPFWYKPGRTYPATMQFNV